MITQSSINICKCISNNVIVILIKVEKLYTYDKVLWFDWFIRVELEL